MAARYAAESITPVLSYLSSDVLRYKFHCVVGEYCCSLLLFLIGVLSGSSPV